MMRLERPRPLGTRPRVSVVIPCYNYGRYLPDAVRSATDLQPGVDVDVCIVDDASTDGSGEVAGRLAADPRVSVIQHEINRGHIQTYNDGLDAVDGDYVVLLSADDLLTPGSLARATALLEHHESVGFVYGIVRSFGDRPAPTARVRVRSWGIWTGDAWLGQICRRGGTTVVNPEVVMRKDVLRKAGGYDPELPHTADMYLWLRAAQIAGVGRVNGADQAFYRVHDANMHLNRFAGVITDLRARAATIDRLLPEPRSGHDDHLWKSCRRTIAYEAVDVAAAAYDRGRTDAVPVGEFAELAMALWPGVVRSARWRLLALRAGTAEPRPWMRCADVARDLRARARWHRWARYGY
jgi:glycosyltransferase involved in cell wall biosynthesis